MPSYGFFGEDLFKRLNYNEERREVTKEVLMYMFDKAELEHFPRSKKKEIAKSVMAVFPINKFLYSTCLQLHLGNFIRIIFKDMKAPFYHSGIVFVRTLYEHLHRSKSDNEQTSYLFSYLCQHLDARPPKDGRPQKIGAAGYILCALLMVKASQVKKIGFHYVTSMLGHALDVMTQYGRSFDCISSEEEFLLACETASFRRKFDSYQSSSVTKAIFKQEKYVLIPKNRESEAIQTAYRIGVTEEFGSYYVSGQYGDGGGTAYSGFVSPDGSFMSGVLQFED